MADDSARGSALLAVVVAGAAIALLTSLLGRMTVELSAAHRARVDVQCARLAAAAAAALWPDALERFGEVAPGARDPSWTLHAGPRDTCRLVVETTCGIARRALVVTVPRSTECTRVARNGA